MAKGGKKKLRQVRGARSPGARPPASAPQSNKPPQITARSAANGPDTSRSLITRRGVLIGGAFAAVAAIAGGYVLLGRGSSDKYEIATTQVQIPWRNVFELRITDRELRQHTERFLDILERGVFPYLLPDPERPGGYQQVEIRGQDIMRGIAVTIAEYEQLGLARELREREICLVTGVF